MSSQHEFKTKDAENIDQVVQERGPEAARGTGSCGQSSSLGPASRQARDDSPRRTADAGDAPREEPSGPGAPRGGGDGLGRGQAQEPRLTASPTRSVSGAGVLECWTAAPGPSRSRCYPEPRVRPAASQRRAHLRVRVRGRRRSRATVFFGMSGYLITHVACREIDRSRSIVTGRPPAERTGSARPSAGAHPPKPAVFALETIEARPTRNRQPGRSLSTAGTAGIVGTRSVKRFPALSPLLQKMTAAAPQLIRARKTFLG